METVIIIGGSTTRILYIVLESVVKLSSLTPDNKATAAPQPACFIIIRAHQSTSCSIHHYTATINASKDYLAHSFTLFGIAVTTPTIALW